MTAPSVPAPPARPATATEVLRATPWLRLALAFASALAVGIATAWIIQATGTWFDGASCPRIGDPAKTTGIEADDGG